MELVRQLNLRVLGDVMKSVFSFLFIFILGATASADSIQALGRAKPFVRWKEEQVIGAKNKVVRLSNLLLLLKSEKYEPENSIPQVAQENKQDISIPETQQMELIAQTENQLSEAIASLEVVKDLTLKDYFSVYLQQFKNEPQALEALAAEMDKAEIAEILRSLIAMQQAPISTSSYLRVHGGAEAFVDKNLDKQRSDSEGIISRVPSKL